jgi:hypothetical protein
MITPRLRLLRGVATIHPLLKVLPSWMQFGMDFDRRPVRHRNENPTMGKLGREN